MALHMICFYGQPALREWFIAQYAKSGKKLDMGVGCLRFKTLPELALDVVESTVARLPVEDYIAGYQAMRKPLRGKAPNPKPQAPRSWEKASEGKLRVVVESVKLRGSHAPLRS